MAPNIVRPSKFRRVYGTSYKRSDCYDSLKITPNAWDSNICKVNPSFFSVNWNAGGGAFGVVPLNEKGRNSKAYIFTGHNAAVLDTDFSPFNDNVIVSASDDAKVRVWNIPSEIDLKQEKKDYYIDTSESTLTDHQKKVGLVRFHNQVENLLFSAGAEGKINIWDVNKSTVINSIEEHKDIINGLDFSYTGTTLATTCKDKLIRTFDIRSNKLIGEAKGHEGLKAVRCAWMGRNDSIITSGFSKFSERQLYVWDLRNFTEPVIKEAIDNSSGILMLFYDPDTNMVYAAGKSDGNIRYYEYVDGNLYYLDSYQSNDTQRGVGFMPKRGLDVNENEVARIYKVIGNSLVEPVTFKAPRKAETFQPDIFPDTLLPEPSLSLEDFYNGVEPKLRYFSMETGYNKRQNKPLTLTPQSIPHPQESEQEDHKQLKFQVEELKNEIEQLTKTIEAKDIKIQQLELSFEKLKNSIDTANKDNPKEQQPSNNDPEPSDIQVQKQHYKENSEELDCQQEENKQDQINPENNAGLDLNHDQLDQEKVW